MIPAKTPEEAYAVCEAIAENRTRATARNAYGDGYRAAAEHIMAEIRANRVGRPSSAELDRELREVELEARVMVRVIDAAVHVVERSGIRSDAADAIRLLVSSFFDSDDLPPVLRSRERTSGMQLVGRDGPASDERVRSKRSRSVAG
jgi:hypothetical protein